MGNETLSYATLLNGVSPVKKSLACAAGIALVFVSVFAAEAQSVRRAPELTFMLPGPEQKQLNQYRGKVVAVEFIYTTCPHCQAASHLMTKLQQEYGARGLQVIDIAINPNADLLVENFVKDNQVGFPVGWSTPDEMQRFMGFSIMDRYVVPQLALIDRKGYIHYQTPAIENENWEKTMNEAALRQHIEELLSLGNNSASRRNPASSRAALAR